MALLFDPLPPVLAATSTGDSFPVRRVFCVGRNYAAHAREMGSDPDREPPCFFTKWAETVVPGGSIIPYPAATADYHHEGELVVAIGKGGQDIPAASALDHVYGYAAGLDMTRRDLQGQMKDKGQSWDIGKNFAAAAPLGIIHPVVEVGHLSAGAIRLTVNGAVKQQGDLSDLIWPIADVIAHLSRAWRLEAGDLIYTGTPAGVGPVLPGDEIVVSITGLSDLAIRIGAPV
jgi:fumarylpyruvate hydrolase